MALLVSGAFDTPFGTQVGETYWRWSGMGVNVAGRTINLTLCGYVSARAYADGKQPVAQREFSVTGDDFAAVVMGTPAGPTLSDALSNAVYAYAKQTDPFFAGAMDAE